MKSIAIALISFLLMASALSLAQAEPLPETINADTEIVQIQTIDAEVTSIVFEVQKDSEFIAFSGIHSAISFISEIEPAINPGLIEVRGASNKNYQSDNDKYNSPPIIPNKQRYRYLIL